MTRSTLVGIEHGQRTARRGVNAQTQQSAAARAGPNHPAPRSNARSRTPNFHPAGLAVHWTDLCEPVGVGGVWLCVYLGQLRAERRATDTGLRPAEAYHG